MANLRAAYHNPKDEADGLNMGVKVALYGVMGFSILLIIYNSNKIYNRSRFGF